MAGPQVIYGLRHARTALDVTHRSDGWIDLPLSDEGRQNLVSVLADNLKAIQITMIFAPDLRRTQETAHIIRSGMPSNPAIVTENATKTWNLGALAGEQKKPNKPVVKHLIKHPNIIPLGGESYGQFKNRFDSFMGKQMADVESGKITGPILDIFSGSNCRRLSEKLLGDREVLNVDESGLFMLYPSGDGKWSGIVISGHAANDEAS